MSKNEIVDNTEEIKINTLSIDVDGSVNSVAETPADHLLGLVQAWMHEGNPIIVCGVEKEPVEFFLNDDGVLTKRKNEENTPAAESSSGESIQNEATPLREGETITEHSTDGTPAELDANTLEEVVADSKTENATDKNESEDFSPNQIAVEPPSHEKDDGSFELQESTDGEKKSERNATLIVIKVLAAFVAVLAVFALCLFFHKPDKASVIEPEEPAAESILAESFENIQSGVIEDGALTLFYDDRFSFEVKVSEIKSQKVISKAVDSDNADDAVLKQDDTDENRVIAVGCGEADVCLENGEEIHVEVTAAPISLLLIAGQSNGEGRLADNVTVEQASEEYVLNEEGQAYDTYGVSDYAISSEVTWIEDPVEDMSVDNYSQFLPESLTDNTKNGLYNSTNTITDGRTVTGKGGVDSALAYRWRELTGEKLWIVNAAHHGSRITSWLPSEEVEDNNFWQAVLLYQGAEQILSQEIEAGHYVLRHKGVIWCQGERDYEMEPDRYLSYFQEMVEGLRKELSGEGIAHLNHDIEFTAIMMVRAAMNEPSPENDFLLTGPRFAQYYIASSQDDENIFLASQIEEQWIDDEHVRSYFQREYGTEEDYQQAYPTTSDTLKMPRKTKDVHCGFHHSQRAYNEIGFDTAYNICRYMKYIEAADTTEEEFQIVMEEGKTDVSGTTVLVQKGVYVPMAVKVSPTYRQKEIQIECSDNVRYSPLGIQLTNHQNGTLTVTLGDVSKTVTIEPKS